MGSNPVVSIKLYYDCPVHGHFSVEKKEGEKWDDTAKCPYCGAISFRNLGMTSISVS
jgi:hypothetical protein